MLFSRSEGCEVEPPHDTLFKGFGNLYKTRILYHSPPPTGNPAYRIGSLCHSDSAEPDSAESDSAESDFVESDSAESDFVEPDSAESMAPLSWTLLCHWHYGTWLHGINFLQMQISLQNQDHMGKYFSIWITGPRWVKIMKKTVVTNLLTLLSL